MNEAEVALVAYRLQEAREVLEEAQILQAQQKNIAAQ